jgi:hypothetical protein
MKLNFLAGCLGLAVVLLAFANARPQRKFIGSAKRALASKLAAKRALAANIAAKDIDNAQRLMDALGRQLDAQVRVCMWEISEHLVKTNLNVEDYQDIERNVCSK